MPTPILVEVNSLEWGMSLVESGKGMSLYHIKDVEKKIAEGRLKALTLPSEMGELFKVMALARAVEDPLVGFGLRDLRPRLGLERAPGGAGGETWT